jgi:hypothetical protein
MVQMEPDAPKRREREQRRFEQCCQSPEKQHPVRILRALSCDVFAVDLLKCTKECTHTWTSTDGCRICDSPSGGCGAKDTQRKSKNRATS